jgi:hypothetical protein
LINEKEELDEKSVNNLKNQELNDFKEYYPNNDDDMNDEITEEDEKIDVDPEIFDENDIDIGEDNQGLNIPDEKLFENEAKLYIEVRGEFIKINRDLIIKSILHKYQTLPKINSLTKVSPHPVNLNSLIYFIGSTIFVFRLYNGDIFENIDEIFDFCTDVLSPLYDKSIVFSTISEAMNYFLLKLAKREPQNLVEFKNLVESDFQKIFESKFYVIETLFRLYEIFHKFDLSKVKKSFHKNITLSKHKIIYFLSYVKSLSNETITSLKETLLNYFKELSEISKLGRDIKKLNIINN